MNAVEEKRYTYEEFREAFGYNEPKPETPEEFANRLADETIAILRDALNPQGVPNDR